MIRPWFRQAAVPWKTTATQTRESGENRVSTKPGVLQVAEACAASACSPGGGGFVAGGEGPPGADFADVGGDQQQRGEQGLGGDAADAAAAGLGEGLVEVSLA